MPSFEAIVVIVVLLFLIVSLYKEIVGPALTFLIAVIVLAVARILEPSEILSGFANEQIAIIIMLLLLGDIYRKTSVLDIMFDLIFRSAKTTRGFTFRMFAVIGPMSAFLNNTPLVALMMPYVNRRAKQKKEFVSKLMIPLSFATILGGCATLIGTSTNLIVNGLVTDQHIIPNLPPLKLFDFFPVGGAMLVLGTVYILFFGQKVLPKRNGPIDDMQDVTRRYIVEARIKAGSVWVGKTIKEAGLRNMQGLYLFEIIREDIRITAVSDDAILYVEDILLFTGSTQAIADLVQSTEGLQIPSVGMYARKKNTEVIEAVIPHNSTLIGNSLKQVNFRSRFDATAIAIHRNGETLKGQIGKVVLKAGDAVLLLSGTYFEARMRDTSDLFLISRVKEFQRMGIGKTIFLIAGTVAVIAFSALGFFKFFTGLLVLLTALLLLKVTNPRDLAKSIDYDLALIIAMSLALGTAMMKTGIADVFAGGIISLFKPWGAIGLMSGIYFITTLLAAYITNKAAVAVVFPVALSMALEMNLPPTPFILIVAYAAAANFMTPIGYQTNLMVYGPGGYKFTDYFKIGAPLTFLYMVVTVTMLYFIYF